MCLVALAWATMRVIKETICSFTHSADRHHRLGIVGEEPVVVIRRRRSRGELAGDLASLGIVQQAEEPLALVPLAGAWLGLLAALEFDRKLLPRLAA